MRTPAEPKNLLLIALSGRAMARSLARAGIATTVVDAFGDADTRAAASAWFPLPVTPAFDVRERALLRMIERVARDAQSVVYGGGLEGCPALIDALALNYAVSGNPGDVLRRVRNPRVFFPLLDELGVPHPEVRWHRPLNPSAWLWKPVRGSGGRGIRSASGPSTGEAGYFQRRLPGIPMSALFLADGRGSRVLGWNRQWTQPRGGDRYAFAGLINRADLPLSLRKCIATRIQSLVAALELRGLMSLDFILYAGDAQVLEINPRPPASFELHEEADHSLILGHVRACAGMLPPPARVGRRVRALRVLYARRAVDLTARQRWPRWCRDIPAPGTRLMRGQPVCTVHAQAAGVIAAEALLAERMSRLDTELYAGDGRP